jgi:hypothetical protein
MSNESEFLGRYRDVYRVSCFIYGIDIRVDSLSEAKDGKIIDTG